MSEEKVAQPSIVGELLLCRSVYSIAFEAAMRILELSQGFPRGGPESIHAQSIRLSSNVCESLTKAWQNRDKPGIFVEKLNDASVSASDTQNQIEAAEHSGLITAEIAHQLNEKYEEVIGKIAGMIKDNS
jgi:four helix bundle protein